MLRLRDAGRMPRQQVNAIQHLVASAVPGLRPQRVSVVDDRGVLLARGQPKARRRKRRLDLRRNARTTKRVSRTIEELLERTLGPGRVRAEVSAEMDFDRSTNTETFDPDGQVVRSSQTVKRPARRARRDDAVSVGGNLPDAAAERPRRAPTTRTPRAPRRR